MKIVYKNAGEYIPYELDGNKLSVNDELTLALDRYERDDPVHIDICRDKQENLVAGVIPGVADWYIAQIDIPAREYDHIADGTDEYGNPKEVPVPAPFEPDNVTLTLWALERGPEQYIEPVSAADVVASDGDPSGDGTDGDGAAGNSPVEHD